MAYLDHNATSPLRPEARAAMERAFDTGGNPSSIHAQGRRARVAVERAREQVAALVAGRAQDLIFTSSGTEANALAIAAAIQGAAEAGARLTRIFASAIEHDSVLANVAVQSERVAGLRSETIPVTREGIVDLEALRCGLREGKGRALVAVMAVNNETGVIQPLEEVASLAKEAGALLLVDAIQAAGKIALDVEALEADYLSLSAHKIGGPQGIGALFVKDGAPFSPLLRGGGQERGRRAGTENVFGIVGFGAAADAARHDVLNTARLATLRDRFERRLHEIAPGAVVIGAESARVANTSDFALPGLAAETSLIALDLDGVMVSSGAACSSGKVARSHVLAAMGFPEEISRCALRASFGWSSGEEDVDAAIASLSKLLARRTRAAA